MTGRFTAGLIDFKAVRVENIRLGGAVQKFTMMSMGEKSPACAPHTNLFGPIFTGCPSIHGQAQSQAGDRYLLSMEYRYLSVTTELTYTVGAYTVGA